MCNKNVDLCIKTIQILCLIIKSYYNHNKDLKVIIIRCTQKKSIKLVCKSEILRVFEAKAKLKMLSKECKSKTNAKEKEKCKIF